MARNTAWRRPKKVEVKVSVKVFGPSDRNDARVKTAESIVCIALGTTKV